MLRFFVLWCLGAVGLLQAQAPAVTLRIAAENGGVEFHQGERIGLILTFETSEPGKWMVLLSQNGRSPLWPDKNVFVSSPAVGTTDPLGSRARVGVVGGSLGFPGRVLDAPTTTYHVDLNQWVRFERPGYYRVHAVFHPMIRQFPGFIPVGQPDFTVESNDIGVNILAADSAWQGQELQSALAVLNTVPNGPDNKTREARDNAARQIAYLDTPDSIRESARLLGGDDQNLAYILRESLLDSAHRDEAVAAMKQVMNSPDQPITQLLEETLAELQNNRTRPDIASAVANKQGAARAISLNTLIDNTQPDAVTPAMRAEIARLFAELPAQRQSNLLQSQWKKIAGPAMIPVLRQIYDNPPQPYDYDLVAAAVQRLYELDPAQGRTIILDEMRLESSRLPYRVLSLLPDATLPDLDQVFAEHLERYMSDRDLIGRYATGAILERVKAWYAKRNPLLACEGSIVAYFLRVDPAWGEPLFRRILADRGDPKNNCWKVITSQTALYSPGPTWEKLAIGSLQDPSVAVKIDTVKALAQHGSPESAAPVWAAFRYWHDWWKGRAAQMNQENREFEQVFVDSISYARNWPATPADFDSMRDLCITSDCIGRVEGHRSAPR